MHPAHRDTESWREHEDINEVMLATSLAPEGFLVLCRPMHLGLFGTPTDA